MIAAAVLLVLLAGYGYGKAHYAKDKQIVQPIQEYYKANPDLASSEDAEDLLQDIWDDNDSEDWVNGSSNTGYLSIKKLHDNWDDSESVANYNEVVSVPSTGPAGSGKTYVNYTVTHNLSYTGDKDDTSVTDTYQNGIISQDSDGDYVLEKLGTPNAK
ncbi:hypothetical protein [Lactobacillus delbrueckii]|uniref:hypothetical protein n=1 Tax=Lactobacillus delbrueckii TaxID=1584 RepID=UPI001E606736|nr:hypothetical protein [Lactobacillus delbrueckii]MCD5535167.1 hypothetical protein [Lactobacillus delbrueckii subsp. sunkii]